MKNLFLLFIAFLFLSGCASFPQNEVAQVNQMPDVSGYKHKPSVFVDFKFFQGEPGAGSAIEMPTVREKLIEKIEQSIKQTSLFSSVTFDEFQKEKVDYTIKMYSYNHGDAGAAAASGFITGFSLGIIPGAATDNYTLKVELVDKAGRLIKTIENKDSVTTWIGLWFIPVMGNTPEKAITSTLENQIRSALKALVESGQLKYSLLEYIDNIYGMPTYNG